MGDNNNKDAAQGEGKEQQLAFTKGITFDKLITKFDDKISKEKAKAFEQKFAAKYKELDNAQAIVNNITKELEKMFTEFNEGL